MARFHFKGVDGDGRGLAYLPLPVIFSLRVTVGACPL